MLYIMYCYFFLKNILIKLVFIIINYCISYSIQGDDYHLGISPKKKLFYGLSNLQVSIIHNKLENFMDSVAKTGNTRHFSRQNHIFSSNKLYDMIKKK